MRGRGMDWIELTEDRDIWRALVNAAVNLGVPLPCVITFQLDSAWSHLHCWILVHHLYYTDSTCKLRTAVCRNRFHWQRECGFTIRAVNSAAWPFRFRDRSSAHQNAILSPSIVGVSLISCRNEGQVYERKLLHRRIACSVLPTCGYKINDFFFLSYSWYHLVFGD